MLRKLFFVSLLSLLSLLSFATGQSGDVIFIRGEEWQLLGAPIESNRELREKLQAFLPENHTVSTGNWKGYTAYWRVESGTLYLEKITVELYDREKKVGSRQIFDTHALQSLFADYYEEGKIKAGWVAYEIRLARGEMLYYLHSGYNRNYEEELFLQVEAGKIVGERLCKNTASQGLTLVEVCDSLRRSFPYEEFREQWGGQEPYFHLFGLKVTPEGRLKDIEIKCSFENKKQLKKASRPLKRAVRKFFEDIYPWKVICLYGAYQAPIEHHSFTLSQPSYYRAPGTSKAR